MDMNNVNIEEIVKQVLSGMTGTAPAAAAVRAPIATYPQYLLILAMIIINSFLIFSYF